MRIIIIIIITLFFSCSKEEKSSILFVGDSHIYKWDTNYFLPEFNVQNLGIIGERIIELDDRLPQINNVAFDKLVIQIGINDILSDKNTALSIPERLDKLSEDYLQLFESLSILEQEIFFLSVIPLTKSNTLENSKEMVDGINEFVEHSLSHMENLSFVDISSALKDENGYIDRQFLIDDLHLNSEGYRYISIIVLNEIG